MLIGLVVGPLLTGVSTAWWKRSHNAHHVVTNSITHDPDIREESRFASETHANVLVLMQIRIRTFLLSKLHIPVLFRFAHLPVPALNRILSQSAVSVCLQCIPHRARRCAQTAWRNLERSQVFLSDVV